MPELLTAAQHGELAAMRCITVVGLPGMGKSLCVRELAARAVARGQPVHLLQWDVARLAWDTPAILQRFPEIDGVTHPVIRQAAGLWVRQAVQRWWAEHPAGQQLIIEAPLVGGRFTQLAARGRDEAEAFLASAASVFLVMWPTETLQRLLRQRREQQSRAGTHAFEQHNASVAVLDLQMQVIRAAAGRLGLPVRTHSGYDPALYQLVMQRVLQHRRTQWLRQDAVLDTAGSVYDLPSDVPRIEAGADEVARTLSQAAALDSQALRRAVDSDWALT